MANNKSAIKRIRQNEKRRIYNRNYRNRARTFVKKARIAINALRVATPASASTELASAIEATRLAVRDLDKAVTRGVIHKRNAARRKSRLMKQLAQLQARQQQ